MTDPDWSNYYTAAAQYGGTLFAIATATRIVLPYDRPRGRYWVYEGLGYLIELAIATFMALAMFIPKETALHQLVTYVLPLGGIGFLITYVIVFIQDVKEGHLAATPDKRLHFWQVWLNVLPLAAYVVLVLPLFCVPINADWTATAITWLLVSGTLQICLVFVMREKLEKKRENETAIAKEQEQNQQTKVLTIWPGWSITREVKHKQDKKLD